MSYSIIIRVVFLNIYVILCLDRKISFGEFLPISGRFNNRRAPAV